MKIPKIFELPPPSNSELTLENQWLEDEFSFSDGLFSGVNSLLVSGRGSRWLGEYSIYSDHQASGD